MLEGRRFTIFTDHKPLTYALQRTSDPWSARQARQLSYLAEYTDDIRHIAGEENIVADTLSRPPPSAAAGVKEPSGSPAAAWQGGKPESSQALLGTSRRWFSRYQPPVSSSISPPSPNTS